MKKFFLAMLVAAATMVSFTSCNKDDKDDATAPEAEYTFAGTTDNGQSSFSLVLTTGQEGNLFVFTSSIDVTPSIDYGTFSFSGSNLTLNYIDPVSGESYGTETLVADKDITSKGLKKVDYLTYDLGDGTVKLRKQ